MADEFETFWDNVDAELESNKAAWGLQSVQRGDMGDGKLNLTSEQATTWIQLQESPTNVYENRFTAQITAIVFITGKPHKSIHTTHLNAMNKAMRVGMGLHKFNPLAGDSKNGGAHLKFNVGESFEVVDGGAKSYTVTAVFNAKIVIEVA